MINCTRKYHFSELSLRLEEVLTFDAATTVKPLTRTISNSDVFDDGVDTCLARVLTNLGFLREIDNWADYAIRTVGREIETLDALFESRELVDRITIDETLRAIRRVARAESSIFTGETSFHELQFRATYASTIRPSRRTRREDSGERNDKDFTFILAFSDDDFDYPFRSSDDRRRIARCVNCAWYALKSLADRNDRVASRSDIVFRSLATWCYARVLSSPDKRDDWSGFANELRSFSD